ncbi:DUF2249 domain-containing protein [Arachidicoccus sp.]|uniref:DUF2249 domain-containing protein n=1 Tax=Arachidicoccus sp. TaxID=1872624 RepID=UPI003D20431A
MKITKDTRISEIIKEDKQSIDAIASLAKVLEKLKNPMLRKLMASRVTIAEAAKMGGVQIQDMVRVLKPLGFEFEENNNSEQEELKGKPDWLTSLKDSDIHQFDVRQMLAVGNDPLKEIMKQFKEVEIGKTLCIINTFVPTPLIRLFEKDNALCYTETISANEFHTYFLKQRKKGAVLAEPRKSQIFTEPEEVFTQNKARYSRENLIEIDVRTLEMPGPMETILSELAKMPTDKSLLVNHKRVPIYLLDELEDKGFQIHIFHFAENEVKLLIEKIK